jgi:hypothetical protein
MLCKGRALWPRDTIGVSQEAVGKLASLALCAVLGLLALTCPAAAKVPRGFTDSRLPASTAPCRLAFGPNGRDQALCYTARRDGVWEVRRISALQDVGGSSRCGEGLRLSMLLLVGIGFLHFARRRGATDGAPPTR